MKAALILVFSITCCFFIFSLILHCFIQVHPSFTPSLKPAHMLLWFSVTHRAFSAPWHTHCIHPWRLDCQRKVSRITSPFKLNSGRLTIWPVCANCFIHLKEVHRTKATSFLFPKIRLHLDE